MGKKKYAKNSKNWPFGLRMLLIFDKISLSISKIIYEAIRSYKLFTV